MTRYATEYGAFCIEQIPNQPQVAHCHSFHIKDAYRGRGLAKQLKLFQCHVLQTMSYDYATCTTAGDSGLPPPSASTRHARRQRHSSVIARRCAWRISRATTNTP